MSIKDDLREYAHSKGLNKYNDVKQKIVKEIKEEIAGCEKEVTVSWGSYGYGYDDSPSVSLVENVMEEIDLPYDIEIDYDVLRLKIKIKELYED